MKDDLRNIELTNELAESGIKLMKLKIKFEYDVNNLNFEEMRNDIIRMEEEINYTVIIGLELYQSIPYMQPNVEEMLLNNKKMLDNLNEIKNKLGF